MIKKILFSALFMMIGYCSFGQSGIYTITEKMASVSSPSAFDKVYVTDPNGVVSTYDIPHFVQDVEGHDSELIVIINNIISLGYEIKEAGGWNYPMIGTQPGSNLENGYIRTMFLGVPWTGAGLVPAGVNNSSFSIDKVYPNPSDKELNIVLGSDAIKGKVVVINMKGFIMLESSVNQEKEIKMDISQLKPGKYVLRLVDDKFYTDEVPFVRN